MKSLRNALDKILEWCLIFIFASMVIVATYQVVTRYFFNAPSTLSEELLTYSFAWMSLLATAYVFGKKEHMRMEFFIERFSEKTQLYVSIISEVLILVFVLLVMVYGGSSIMKLTLTQMSASLRIPMGYIYSVVPLAGILTIIYNSMNLVDLSRTLKEHKREVLQ